jgi:GDP-4-dehydro-6-deoxy-D-mannose reductase
MSTIMVTGAGGFVGKHLVAELLHAGYRVIGLERSKPADWQSSDPNFSLQEIDLTDENSTAQLDLGSVQAVIHLAGLASTGESFAHPQTFIAANSAMLVNLMERAKATKSRARFVVISSGAVYDPAQPLPLNEASRTVASSPYVISKLLLEDLCQYYQSLGLDTVVVRPFNHTGPGQRPGFLLPDLIAGARLAVKEKQPLTVGNLQTKRDYSDVRDVVKAYRLLATAAVLPQRLYNVCSGKSTQGIALLDMVFDAMQLQDKPTVSVDQSRIRPTDAPELFGDYSRLHAAVGWQPQIPLTQTVHDFLAVE